MTRKRTALILDDHSMVREGLQWILESTQLFESINLGCNGIEGLQRCGEIEYDVILVDLRMPQMNGIDFIIEKVRLGFNGKIIVITSYDDPLSLSKLRALPISAYLLKDASREEIIQKVKEVLEQEVIETEDRRRSPDLPKSCVGNSCFDSLTKREWEILQDMMTGITSKYIASHMKVSERTIKAHLTNIYRKLNVSSRTEATALVLNRQNGVE